MDETTQESQIAFRYQLEAFLNGIAGSVYWKDTNGIYLGCNNAVLKKGNLKNKKDVIGKSDSELWPTHAEQIRKTDREVIDNDQIIEIEETVLLPSGEKLYFSSLKAPLKDVHGNIIGIIGNSFDITELKLARQNAEAASRAKTQFLALMSHELRIPLTGIISTASMLADQDFTTEEAKELGKIIVSSGNHLLSTINNILYFAKLEADKFDVIHEPVNLPNILHDIISLLDSNAKEKNLTLTTHIETPIPTIYSDPRALRHIITNLISNAIKFTEYGFVTVSINILNRNTDDITIEIAVKDTGIGIPNEKLDFIFDRFSQVENVYTRKNSRNGTGLGLSLVKKLTESLAGDIRVNSTIGQGSTFYFTGQFALSHDNSHQPNIEEIEYGYQSNQRITY